MEKHFYFTPDGRINSNTQEGEVSKTIYDLNRDELVHARRKESDKYTRRINRYLKKFEKSDKTESIRTKLLESIEELYFEIIEEEEDRSLEYSAYRFYMANNFEAFFIETSTNPSLLKEIYQEILNKF